MGRFQRTWANCVLIGCISKLTWLGCDARANGPSKLQELHLESKIIFLVPWRGGDQVISDKCLKKPCTATAALKELETMLCPKVGSFSGNPGGVLCKELSLKGKPKVAVDLLGNEVRVCEFGDSSFLSTAALLNFCKQR